MPIWAYLTRFFELLRVTVAIGFSRIIRDIILVPRGSWRLGCARTLFVRVVQQIRIRTVR
eukprot:scaffold216503_cov23-Prasinocladus_malaysianus.AAC.1